MIIIILSILLSLTTNTPKNPIYETAIKYSKTKMWIYDPTYYRISYPNGDVPGGGACTDVIIRILRKNGMDLQKLVHQDMSNNFSKYPKRWGLSKPDPNIDHRRVYNLMVYFKRAGYDVGVSSKLNDYKPGDIVCWELAPGISHIGIALENGDIYHNIGPYAKVDKKFLFNYPIIGHYRVKTN